MRSAMTAPLKKVVGERTEELGTKSGVSRGTLSIRWLYRYVRILECGHEIEVKSCTPHRTHMRCKPCNEVRP
jgi:hypothetical protein